MSRIDEALRRARSARYSSPENDLAPRQMDKVAFDLYPSEQGPRTSAGDVYQSEQAWYSRIDSAAVVSEPAPDVKQLAAGAAVLQPRGARSILDGAAVSGNLPDRLVGNPSAAVVAQYRRIASALQNAQKSRGLKAVVITSASPGEGRTTTAVNLAVILSELHQRSVLLIDADRRNPSVAEVLGIPNDAGFREALSSDSTQITPAAVAPLLNVLTIGDRSAESELNPQQLQDLLTQCAGTFDWTIFDCSPASALGDARMLIQLTQAAVFVIGATPFPVVQRTMEELGRGNILSTLLPRVATTSRAEASV